MSNKNHRNIDKSGYGPIPSDGNQEQDAGKRPEQENTITTKEMDGTDRVLTLVDAIVDADKVVSSDVLPASDEADLPLLSAENTVEVRGGNLSDAGFMQLQRGAAFRGFYLERKWVDSQYGVDRPVMEGQMV